MAVGFSLLFAALLLVRMRTLLNERRVLALRLNRVPAHIGQPRAAAAR
jgi:hypothetical protein